MRALLVSLALLLAAPAAAKAPEKGARADFLKRYQTIQEKILSLVDAMTQEQLQWTPGEGVMSWTEALLHVVQTNYKQAAMLGLDTPKGVDVEALGKIRDKAALAAALKASYAHVGAAVEALSDADLDQEITIWGKPGTKRFALILALAHSAEHLGQGIAYARMNGVTPPWSRKK